MTLETTAPALLTAEGVADAITSAHTVHQGWSRTTTVADRVALMNKVAVLVEERKDELAALMHAEMGKPLEECVEETEFAAAIYQYYADNAEAFLADEPVELMAGTGTAFIRRQPIGVLLGIMPWNFPQYQVARFAGPNLLAGNTVLLKHASICPGTAAAIEQIMRDAGFPEGAYVNLYASHSQLADIIADPRVQGVSLTGSEAAGASVAELAGKHLKKVVLELGGSDPFVVMSTDDLEATVQDAIDARFYNTGQVCNAAKRFIVVEELYDDFVAAMESKLGSAISTPLSSLGAAEQLAAQVQEAVDGGATLRISGEPDGAFYPAAILEGVTADNPAYYQELFGPVATMFKVSSEEEAIAIANDTPFGLGSYVYSTDPEQAARIADRIEAGMVFVNGVNADGAELQFGGVKRSGFGRELGRAGMEEFLNKKLIRTIA